MAKERLRPNLVPTKLKEILAQKCWERLLWLYLFTLLTFPVSYGLQAGKLAPLFVMDVR